VPWRVATGVSGCDGFAVVKKDSGKLVACHKDRAGAEAQVRALYANEAQTASAVGALARELLEDGGSLVARGELLQGPRGRMMSRTELGVRLDEAEGRAQSPIRGPFDPAKHPRHPKGVREGGRFMVKTNAEGRYEVVAPNGKKVAETTEPEAADKLAADANEAETRVPIGVGTSQDIPNAWAVEQGYADWVDKPERSTGFSYRVQPVTPGSIRWKPGVNPEVVLTHYLSGTKPENFEPGTVGWEQWMYGRQEPAETPLMPGVWSRPYENASDRRARLQARRDRVVKRPGTRAARDEMVRRLTAALAAAGFLVEGDEPDEALVASIREQLSLYEDALVASVTVPTAIPGAWFARPEPDRPTPWTVLATGEAFGHLALWDSCHIGDPGGPGVCVAPPRSGMDYGLFHLGEIETAEGDLVAVGKVTLDTGHASLQASRNAAAAHYDNTGTVGAAVRARDGRFGIWMSGGVWPGLTQEKVAALRAAGVSGDWRRFRNQLELVAALAVNVPGFPIPRVAALVAPELDGDDRLALVAAGVILEPVPMSDLEIDARLEALALLAGVADL
jgi:hypothetical protein